MCIRSNTVALKLSNHIIIIIITLLVFDVTLSIVGDTLKVLQCIQSF